jgi:FkbM family methyltransferase
MKASKKIIHFIKKILSIHSVPSFRHLLNQNLNEILGTYNNIEYGAELNPVDAFFSYRLLLGRNPNLSHELPYLLSNSNLTFREFINNLIDSEEFSKSTNFLPANKILMSEIENFRFWFNSSDREMGVRMALGLYEPLLVELIKKTVKPGMTCIDAGANTGFYTCLMAANGANVYAFEPMPNSYNLLVKNVQENNFQSRVQAYQIACSDGDKSISGSIVSNMYITSEVADAEKVTMNTVAVDNILSSHIDIIKVDIEGHEPKALEGMKNILTSSKPIIFSEINEYWLRQCSGIEANEYIRILNNFQYKVFDIRDLNLPLSPGMLKLDILDTMEIVAFHIDHVH